jgi:hypothetical protein
VLYSGMRFAIFLMFISFVKKCKTYFSYISKTKPYVHHLGCLFELCYRPSPTSVQFSVLMCSE